MSDDLRVFVRDEEPDDYARVFEVTEAAFGGLVEPRLNDDLRREVSPYLSQVATRGSESGEIIGHAMWSRVEIHGEPRSPEDYTSSAFALGPISVWPEEQRSGIGGTLNTIGSARRSSQTPEYSVS